MTAIAETPSQKTMTVESQYSNARLLAGLLGRCWLWFLGVSLAISMLPLLWGWSSFVIVTGSMEPGISAGDVVIASPGYDADTVLGRVITFDDPSRDDNILTHRVHSIATDGTLTTKGDANPTPDSMSVQPDDVTGTGRLLVQFVGLPVAWAMAGNWPPLFLFLLLLVAAVIAAFFDYEPAEPWAGRRIPVRTIPTMAVLLVAAPLLIGLGTEQASAAVFTAVSPNTNNSWAIPNWSYTTEVLDLGPYLYWKLDETGSVATAADSSGNGRTGTYNPSGSTTNFARLSNGALVTDSPDRAVRLISTNSCINTTSTTSINAPQVFTIVAWFRARSAYTSGGKILGFERPQTGVSAPSAGAYDRHLYMDGQGSIWFGVYNGAHVALSSTTGLNDGYWHMAVGTQSGSGMRLFIDGALVDSNTNTVAETQTGWWRVGCGNLSGWGGQWGGPNNPGTDSTIPQNRPYTASLDEITVYNSALTPEDVADLYWTR